MSLTPHIPLTARTQRPRRHHPTSGREKTRETKTETGTETGITTRVRNGTGRRKRKRTKTGTKTGIKTETGIERRRETEIETDIGKGSVTRTETGKRTRKEIPAYQNTRRKRRSCLLPQRITRRTPNCTVSAKRRMTSQSKLSGIVWGGPF